MLILWLVQKREHGVTSSRGCTGKCVEKFGIFIMGHFEAVTVLECYSISNKIGGKKIKIG